MPGFYAPVVNHWLLWTEFYDTEIDPIADDRITEDGILRITEIGDARQTEGI